MASLPLSFTAVDIVAGAIDAWVNPQESTAAAVAESKGRQMTAGAIRLRCAGVGPAVTKEDARKSVAVTLVGTLVLVVAWLVAARSFRDNPFVDSFAITTWTLPWAYSLRYTTLKGRPGRVQLVFAVGLMLFLAAVSLLAGWIASL